MSLKQCVKCGEMVDEAKAFCPFCSHAFDVEGERRTSEFELTRDTDTFTQSFFNEILSDMELNISEPPDAPAKPAEPPLRRGPSRSTKVLILIGAVCALLLLVLFALILFLVLR